MIVGSAGAADTVAIDGARPRFTATLVGSCPPVRARLKRTRTGTRVVATWTGSACGLPAKVRLLGLIAAGCHTLDGAVKVGKAILVSFTAPSCGDGVVDAPNGETCDGAAGCGAGLTCVACRCVPSSPTTTTTTLPGPVVSFAREVAPILSANCTGAGCHAGQFAAQGIDMSAAATAYAALTSKQSTESPCTGTRLVVPGSPEASVLVKKLTGTSCGFSQMPLGRPPLGAADLATIRAWIAQGAPDS